MKKIAIIIAAILVLSGCGQSNPTAPAQQPTTQPASTTATIPTASGVTTVIFINHAPVL